MKIVDLTHPLRHGTQGFPGNARVVTWPLQEIAITNYNMLHVSTDLHTGTHVDAPLHCIDGGLDIAQMPLERCTGTALVLDMRHKGSRGDHFEIDDFAPHADAIRQHRKLLLTTGWSQTWDTPDFHDNFPGFRRDAAQHIVDLGLELIGIEQASIHPTDHLEVHKIFFRQNVLIVESLANLSELPLGTVDFFAPPLRFVDGDGSLVRAFARVG